MACAPPKILVIDDDEGVRGFVMTALRRHGFDVAAAAEGGAGLALAAATAFDAVICDIVMPGREGMETIRELRRLAPRLPILAISGSGLRHGVDYLPWARKLGANETLAKPFSLLELLAAVEGLLLSERCAV